VRNGCNILFGKPVEEKTFGKEDENGRIILKWNVNMVWVVDWIQLTKDKAQKIS
jgi:hypothetical protein